MALKPINNQYTNTDNIIGARKEGSNYYAVFKGGIQIGIPQSEYNTLSAYFDKVKTNQYVNKDTIYKTYQLGGKYYLEFTNGSKIEISQTDYNNIISDSGESPIDPHSLTAIMQGAQDITIDLNENATKVIVGMHMKAVLVTPATPEATSGELTDKQIAALKESELSFIMIDHEKYLLMDKIVSNGTLTTLTYTHVSYENNQMQVKSLTVTVSTKTWVLNKKIVTELPATTGHLGEFLYYTTTGVNWNKAVYSIGGAQDIITLGTGLDMTDGKLNLNPPTANGTYKLQCIVTDGVPTISWVTV